MSKGALKMPRGLEMMSCTSFRGRFALIDAKFFTLSRSNFKGIEAPCTVIGFSSSIFNASIVLKTNGFLRNLYDTKTYLKVSSFFSLFNGYGKAEIARVQIVRTITKDFILATICHLSSSVPFYSTS